VGIGIMMIGIITSNTFERTMRFVITENGGPVDAFGYKFEFERFTGHPREAFPMNPDYDPNNAVQVRVTPPAGEGSTDANGSRTFLVNPKWFVFNLATASSEEALQRIRWPHIRKYFGHDLYVGYANDPEFLKHVVSLKKGEPVTVGAYTFLYTGVNAQGLEQGGRSISTDLQITTADGKVVHTNPTLLLTPSGDDSKPFAQTHINVAVPELSDENNVPGVVYLDTMNVNKGEADFKYSLPQAKGTWEVPLEVTYKPWVNLVWVGVIIMGIGVFLAMVRRALEARKIDDGPLAHTAGGGATRYSDFLADEGQVPGEPLAAEGETVANGNGRGGNGRNGHAPAGKPRKLKSPTRP